MTDENADDPAPPAPKPGHIDFEETDFEQARAALEQPPAGVPTVERETAAAPETQRRVARTTPNRLSGQAEWWLERLPPDVRPTELARRHPRLANELAECWNNVPVCLALIDGLLIDRRGGRRGFPSGVALELVALRDFRNAS